MASKEVASPADAEADASVELVAVVAAAGFALRGPGFASDCDTARLDKEGYMPASLRWSPPDVPSEAESLFHPFHSTSSEGTT